MTGDTSLDMMLLVVLFIICVFIQVFRERYRKRNFKIDPELKDLMIGVAEELNIPKEEVLEIYIEFGLYILIGSQYEKSVEDMLKDFIKKKTDGYPELESFYDNWDRIAFVSKLNYEAGQKEEEEVVEE